MDKTIQDEIFVKSFEGFYNHLSQESERGSAIVGAALIDDALEEILKTFMIEPLQNKDELFNGSFAPLESLSAKIALAYRLGLISPNVRTSLDLIRKIRNDFAHISRQINFETESIQDRVRELFNSHKGLFDVIWTIAKDSLSEGIKEFGSTNGLDNLVNKMGWKSTYDVLVSIISATLCAKKSETPKIVPHHRD